MRRLIPPVVETEIRETARWYEERQAGLGKAFLQEVEASLRAVDEQPWIYLFLEVRRVPVKRFRFGIFYILHHDFWGVIAVVHAARRPGRWKWLR